MEYTSALGKKGIHLQQMNKSGGRYSEIIQVGPKKNPACSHTRKQKLWEPQKQSIERWFQEIGGGVGRWWFQGAKLQSEEGCMVATGSDEYVSPLTQSSRDGCRALPHSPPLDAIICQKHLLAFKFLHLMFFLDSRHGNQKVAWQRTCAEHERYSQRMSRSWSGGKDDRAIRR